MSMPLSPTRLFVCTACGAVLPVGPELLGKKCRCGRCGKVSVVAEDSPKRAEQSTAQTQRISFRCRVCDTGLVASSKHVGRKAKCPDCGAGTPVPEPPSPRPPQKPKAMHGQQYGLWGVDDAPSPAEIKAKQPKYFPVFCRNCDTMMHAQPKQIGKKIACPDCGAKTDVKEPPKPKPKKSALVPDGQEYQLDAEHVPPKRLEPQFVHAPTVAREAAESREAKSREVGDPIRQEQVARPKIPRLPTFQGVMKMLVRTPVVTWFAWVTLVGLMAGGFLLVTMMLNPVAAIPFFFGAAAAAILSLSAIGAFCLAVLTESSEGNDRLYNPPGPVFLDWMGEVFYLVFPAMLAPAPWWLLCMALQKELPPGAPGLLMVAGWLFTFPLLLLSSLENGSVLEPFSFRVFGSVTKLPGHWLLFVVESAAIVGGTLAAIYGLVATGSPALMLPIVPLCVASALLYFRVLGRFAWWLSESLATTEEG